MLYSDEANWKSVKDMYEYSSTHNMKLLSEYPSTFWQDYRSNSADYDKMFKRMYKSYRYYEQMPYTADNEVSAITLDFIDCVYTYLAMNDKRFSELYRIKVLDDNSISILENYNTTETLQKAKQIAGSETKGARSDTTSDTIGSRTDGLTRTEGQHIDNLTALKEGFNSTDFTDDSKNNNVYGEQIIGNTNVYGAQSNSSTFAKGQQTDTDTHSENESYTLTKTGSEGNPYDNVRKFQAVWTNFEFITYIFKEICAEFLLI